MASKTIFVGGISTLSYEDLRDHFSRFGHIERVAMKTGFAFITFESYIQAAKACDERFQKIWRQQVKIRYKKNQFEFRIK